MISPLTWSRKQFLLICLGIAIVAVIFLIFFYFFAYRAPGAFPETITVSISDDSSLSQIANTLEEQNIIRSPFWFINFVILFKHERKVMEGDYYFEQPLSVYHVAKRVTRGFYNNEQIKTTIPEGSTKFDIAAILQKKYPHFDTVAFLELATPKEGYLFPDTYRFGASAQPEKIIKIMNDEFQEKISLPDVQALLAESDKPLADIISMASILEREARQMRTRRIVAGILWERLRRGIPFQIDASFRYVNGKSTEDLTLNDLKIDSPYNTYLYKGFPPTPISNPGLDAIEAAVTPIPTDYLYFLTDPDGNMHYAKTLEEHVANKRKYLR